MIHLKPFKIGVISKLPGLASKIVSRLPRLAPQVTDYFEKNGPITPDELQPKTTEEREELACRLVGDSDLIVADMDYLAPVLYDLDNVKWVQSTWAGVDFLMKYVDHDKPYPKYKITRFAGKFGDHMAEYVLGHIVANERNFKRIYKSQEQRKWDVVVQHAPYRLLNSLSICILGIGDIGQRVGKVCKDIGMTVYGFVSKEIPENKKQPFIDEYFHSVEQLPCFLQKSDYICNILPKTNKTNGLLSGDILKNCKERKTVLINIGRGNVIPENDVIRAIESGWIGGAILDVFNEEPLPSNSKLWEFSNVVITPHCSGMSFAGEVADIFVKNYELFENGQELNNIVDWQKEY